jgi:hypothetical protein
MERDVTRFIDDNALDGPRSGRIVCFVLSWLHAPARHATTRPMPSPASSRSVVVPVPATPSISCCIRATNDLASGRLTFH